MIVPFSTNGAEAARLIQKSVREALVPLMLFDDDGADAMVYAVASTHRDLFLVDTSGKTVPWENYSTWKTVREDVAQAVQEHLVDIMGVLFKPQPRIL